MIESLPEATVLVLSALAVLFGVPLAMLLWIASQSIQMRVLRRRLGEVETTLLRLLNQGTATDSTTTVAPSEPVRLPAHAPTKAVDPTAADHASGTATTQAGAAAAGAEPADPRAAVPDAPRAELQPEPTDRELNVPKKRDWLGVSDLPGPVEALLDSGDEAGAVAEHGSPAEPAAEAAPTEPVSESAASAPTAENAPGVTSAADVAGENPTFEGGAPDSPAREWLRRAAGEAERLAASAEQRRTSGATDVTGVMGTDDALGSDSMAAGEIGDAVKDAASDGASEGARAPGAGADDEEGPA